MSQFIMECRRLWKGCAIWCAALAGLFVMCAAFFPSMESTELGTLLSEKLDLLPQGLLDAFGLGSGLNLSDFMEYAAYILQFMMIGAAVYGMILGTRALVSEEGDGTIEFLYAQPVSRLRIVLTKMTASALALTLTGTALLLTALCCAAALGEGDKAGQLAAVTCLSFLPCFIYWAAGFAVSAFLSRSSGAVSLSLGLFFGSYMLGIVAQTVEQLDFLHYLCPVMYAVPVDIFRALAEKPGSEPLSGWTLLLGVALTAAGIVTALVQYRRKDMRP